MKNFTNNKINIRSNTMATITSEEYPNLDLILEAIDTDDLSPHNGSLKINRRKGRGEFVQVSIDPERLFPLAMKALLGGLLQIDEEGTLDFLADVQTKNDGVFPKDEMMRLLAEELAPFTGQLEYTGSGTFKGDRLLNYKRSELLLQRS
jgi:hypothetical protein